MIHLGHVHELGRYPVKSMAGIAADSAVLGWHGIAGDRRFAFRRLNDAGGFPWLSASRLPRLLLYTPVGLNGEAEPTPTHVRTPDGDTFDIRGAELQTEIAEAFGSPVEMMHFKHGIFDEGIISVIDLATISAICSAAAFPVDTRRFRANIVIKSENARPFWEDDWVGSRLLFGDEEAGPIVNVAMRDERCMMINLDPDTAKQDPGFMKAAVRLNGNNAGVYCTVARTGRIAVGQPVRLLPAEQTSAV